LARDTPGYDINMIAPRQGCQKTVTCAILVPLPGYKHFSPYPGVAAFGLTPG